MSARQTMYKIPLGAFELHKPIGKGGMGEVWLGQHVRQGVDVAVKVLTREGWRREEYRDAFDTEVRAVARLDHPGVILMLDHGELSEEAERASHHRLAAGSPYLIMEFARYGSLHDFRDTLRWPELREVLFTILDALAHAHARGVIHRDLKPQNILLGTGELDAVKLTDFGLAHATFEQHERDDLIEEGWGTPQYMAPEQFRGRWRDYGPWTDLYALGCMTYELLTGRVPYQGTTSWELGRAHVLEPVPRLVPRFEVPDGIEEWVLRLLQKVPHERFERAADAALALARLGGPTSATPGVIITGDFKRVSEGLRATYERHAVHTALAKAGRAGGEDRTDRADTVVDEAPTEHLPAMQDETLEAGAPPASPSTTREGVFQFQRSRSVLDWDAYAASDRSDGAIESLRTTAETLLLPVPVLSPPLVPSWRPRYAPPETRALVGAGLGLYGMRELRLIEREAERDLLWEIFRDVHMHGQPRAVVVRGQSGIGKTRLVRWMAARAHELGAATTLTATHNASPAASDGVGPMLARHLRVTGLDRDHTQERLAVELHRHGMTEPHEIIALSELLAPAPVAAADDGDADAPGRYLTHQASNVRATLRHLLGRLAEDRPLIITLEDAQWGPDALLLAHYLLTHTAEDERLPVLLLLTVRDDALAPGGAPRRILDELLGMRRVYACPLSPLTDEGTSRLVGELLGLEDVLARQVVSRAGGVPRFAVELVGDWVARGKLEVGQRGFVLRAGEAADIPDSLHTMWQGRLHHAFAALPPAARLAVEVAAALGNEVRAVEWVEACRQRGLPVERLWLSTLRRAGLIRKTPDGWRFSHHTMRESMERDARDGDRWADHHMACARMLTTLHGAQPPRGYFDRVAHHLIEARELRGAVDPLLRAAQELLDASDLTLALDRLDQREGVLNRMALPEDDSRWALGWVMRAQVLDLLGRSPEAAQWASRALDQASSRGWQELYVVAAIQKGFALLHRGTTRGAEALFTDALTCCAAAGTSVPAAAQAHARIGLARVHQRMGQLDRAEALFEQALAECQPLDDRRLLATCYNGLGDIARQRGAWAEAHSRSERAYHLTRELGDRVLMADCINDLGELYRLMGNLDDAARLCERAARLYESLDSQQSKRAWMNLAYVHLSKRSFREAEQLLRPLVQHFRTHQDDGQLTMAMMGVLPCLADREDWDAFDRALDWVRRLLFTTGRRDADVVVVMDLCIPMLQSTGRHDVADLLDELRDRYGPHPQ